MDDLALLQEYARTNSQEAFATVVSRHLNLVYSVALRRTGNPHAAEEITQAVFIILAKKAGSLPESTVLPAWLFETVRLTVNHFHRDEARRIRREQEACMQSLSSDSEPLIWSQLAPLLDDAIAKLGDKDRKAVVIRFLQEKSLTEVGAALGMSEDAAQKRVARAIEKLRAYFVRRGIVVSVVTLTAVISSNSIQAAPVGMASMVAATAAVKGASAASSILILSKGVLNLMAWAKLKSAVAVGAVLLLAGGTSIIILRQSAVGGGASTGGVTFAPVSATPTNVAGNGSITNRPGFRWDNVESTDYRQYMANLRAAGFPEPLIRDIVLADLHQVYNQRAREILGARPAVAYWQKPGRNEISRAQEIKLKALEAEESAAAKALLGVDTLELGSLLLYADDFSAKVAWLPPDKRDAARKAFRAAELAIEDGGYTAAFERSVALLKSILTPEELEEYKLRESRQAEQLRQDSRYANVTPDEFKALVKIREQVKDRQDQSAEYLHQEIDGLTQALGTERGLELAKKCDRTYLWANVAAERYNLPAESVDQAVQLKWNTLDAAARIKADATLSDTERQQQLSNLRISAEAALVKCMGANGAGIAKYDGEWLRNLTPRP